MKILFSCVGTSDPVRGLRDGGMLHIVRHYQPEKIVLFISKEMQRSEKEDNRYMLALKNLEQHLEEYHPIVERIYDDIEDVSDFDAFYERFYTIISSIAEQNPTAEILLNLSSGTPQMEITMALFTSDIRFHCTGIQVKNPEKSSGKTARTNIPKYELELQLELNEDNEPSAENRCVQPELFIIRRKEERDRIQTLLRRYDYEALASSSMRKALPEKAKALVKHLNYRAQYDRKQAEALAENLKVPFNLYPKKGTRDDWGYKEISEYLLCLKLMQKRGELTHFVLRLNPFILKLQVRFLKEICGLDIRDITEKSKDSITISRTLLHEYSPELEQYLDQKYAPYGLRESYISIQFCNYLIAYCQQQDSEIGTPLRNLEQLNTEQRNTLAHTLNNVDDEAIKATCGLDSYHIVQKLQQVVQDLYASVCEPKLFDIYDTCNDYIISLL